jgi:hypothetical protein
VEGEKGKKVKEAVKVKNVAGAGVGVKMNGVGLMGKRRRRSFLRKKNLPRLRPRLLLTLL